QVLGALAPSILKDTGLNAQQFAVVNSYFFVAYTVANPLWGSILDYVGLRVGMLMGVAIWTIASVSHGWMTGLIGFAMCRALLGLGEGVTFPGGLRTAVESLPASKRARSRYRSAVARLRGCCGCRRSRGDSAISSGAGRRITTRSTTGGPSACSSS